MAEDKVLTEFSSEKFHGALGELKNLGKTEHLVFHPGGAPRCYRVTDAGQYGAGGDLIEYLRRLAYSNKLFNDDFQVEGVVKDPTSGAYSLVVSQPWIADARDAEPDEIRRYFEDHGFERISSLSYRKGDIVVTDAAPGNVIIDDKGVAYPIDVGIEGAEGSLLPDINENQG